MIILENFGWVKMGRTHLYFGVRCLVLSQTMKNAYNVYSVNLRKYEVINLPSSHILPRQDRF